MAVASTVLSRIQIQDRTPGSGLGSDPSQGKNSNFRGNEIVKSSSSNNILTGGKKDKTRLIVTVAIGANGIGLVVTDDESSNYIIIKDLRKMPDNAINPSELAGIKVGDIVEKINGDTPGTLQDAVNLLKNSKNSVTLTILRN